MSNKIKLCFVSGNISAHSRCGVSNYTYKLTKEISSNEDIDLSIITSSTDLKGINNYCRIKKWNFANWKSIKNAIKNFNPQIIHYQHPTRTYGRNIFQFMIPYLVKKYFKNTKVITTIHEFSESPWYAKPWLIFLMKRSDYLIFTNKDNLNHAKKFISLKDKNAQVMHIGSNIEYKNFDDNFIIKEKERILGNRNYLIGYFGFIDEDKGMDLLLKALNILVNKKKGIYKLLIIGSLKKGNPYHKHIRRLINKYSLQDDIYVTGYLEEERVSQYLQMLDLGVLPFRDGVSLRRGSLMAMLSHCVPVISKGNNLKVDLLENNENILMFGKKNELPIKINKIFQDEKLYNKIKNNIKKLKISFEWPSIAKNTYNFYKQILPS